MRYINVYMGSVKIMSELLAFVIRSGCLCLHICSFLLLCKLLFTVNYKIELSLPTANFPLCFINDLLKVSRRAMEFATLIMWENSRKGKESTVTWIWCFCAIFSHNKGNKLNMSETWLAVKCKYMTNWIPTHFCSLSAVVCFDAKINFDDNAEFRQKAVFAMDDTAESDPTETEAAKYDLKYIGLDGNIACFGLF